MQNVSLKYRAVKNFNLKNPRWRTAAVLKMQESRYLRMMQNVSQSPVAIRDSLINFFLTASALRDQFRNILVDRSYCSRDIAVVQFFAFREKKFNVEIYWTVTLNVA